MKIRCTQICVVLLLSLVANSRSFAGDLLVHLPDGVKAQSAAALEPPALPANAAASDNVEDGPMIRGKVAGQLITVPNLIPGITYDLKITLAEGVILRGVNLNWYSREPANPDAGPINDDDRMQIGRLITDVKSFYNISRIVTLRGDHDRATVLVERIRSNAFHSDAGGEVIWRVELWYFVNDFGGWSERPQTSQLLTRQRFKSNAEYEEMVRPIRWIGALGGIKLAKGEAQRELSPKSEELTAPTTHPAP